MGLGYSQLMTRVRTASGVLFIALFHSPPAVADVISSTVTVIGPRFNPAAAPPAESRVGRPRLKRRLPPNLIEGLRGLPGIALQSTTPGQSTPIVRGLLGSAVLVTVDGFPVNSAITRSAPNQYFSLVDPFAIEAVTVRRGGVSAAFGPGALGGVIALSSVRPTFSSFSSDGYRFSGRIASRFAAADLSQLHHLRLSAAGSHLAASVAATFADAGDLRTGSGGPPLPTAHRWYAADGVLRYHAGVHAIEIVAQHLSQPRTPRVDQLVAPVGGGEPAASVFLFEPSDRTFLQLRWAMADTVLRAARAEVAVGWQRLVDGRRTQDFGILEVIRERTTSNLFQGRLRLVWDSFEGGSVRVGILGQVDRVRSTRAGFEPLAPRYADGATAARTDADVQADLTPSRWLSIAFGLRVGAYWVGTPADEVRREIALRGADWSAGVGSSVRVAPGLWLFTNVTRSIRNPNVFDLTTQGPRPFGREQVPPESVDSEHLVGIDGGLRFRRGGARVELEGFAAALRDRIQTITIGKTAGGRRLVTTGNAGEVQLLGAGLDAEWRLHRSLVLHGSLSLTYGTNRAVAGKGREPADRIPPLFGLVGARGRLTEWASYDVTLRTAAPQRRLSARDMRDPRIAPGGTDGYAVVDLGATLELGPQARLQVAVQNGLDARYREHGSGVDAAGRNLLVELEAEY